MKVSDILAGKITVKLDPPIVLKVPTAGDIARLTPTINKRLREFFEKNQDILTGYSKYDAEKDLLKKYPDFYEVIEEAEKKKREILLSLSELETPDERFLKTPEEIAELSDEELKKYLDYYQKQYGHLQQKYIETPIIKKAFEYEQYRNELYIQTDDFVKNRFRKIFWIIYTAEKEDGSPYFNDKEKALDFILNLSYPDFQLLMDVYSGLTEGFGLPF